MKTTERDTLEKIYERCEVCHGLIFPSPSRCGEGCGDAG